MNEETKKLQEERSALYRDFYHYKLPKRLPVGLNLPNHVLAEYAGLGRIDFQFDYARLADAARELCARLYADRSPVSPASMIFARTPLFYQILESQSFVMGAGGFVQHPEVVGMTAEDYDYLVEDAYACLLERVVPRQYKALDPKDPIRCANAIQMAKAASQGDMMASLPFVQELGEKYGYYPGAPMGSSGFSEAPYDFIGDQLRSFSGVSMDIRRNRKKLADACEAVLPLMFHWGLPAKPDLEGSVMTPRHMPTFMREKDFVEVWLPTYLTMTRQWASLGVRTNAFCEDDWMRYLDVLSELPAGMQLMFEYGDPKAIKEKLGKKFLISGLYPIGLLKTGTKQQVLDKAKELLDTMMPGGGYMFGFDKNPLVLGDINLNNYCALAEFVRDYAVYDNPGEPFGTPLNSEGFVRDETLIGPVKSKYLFNWEEFKKKYPLTPDFVQQRMEKIDKDTLSFYMNLLV